MVKNRLNMKHIQTFESINEASKFTFSEAEIKNAAETLAKAMAKLDKVKVAVHDFEYDKGRGAGFELSWDGDKFDGGSYYIKPNGDVVNAAVGGGTTYGNIKSDEKGFIKGIKSSKGNMRTDESILSEATVVKYKKGDHVEYQLTHKGGVGKYANASTKSKNTETGVIRKRTKGIGDTFKYELTSGLELYGSEIIGLTESILNEGGMSEMYTLAQEAKDEAEFIKDFFKENGDKVKKTPASIKWAKSIYTDAMEMALESVLQEGTFIDLRIVKENVEDDIELALTNWLNTLADGNAVKMSDLYLENGVLLGTVAKDIKQGRVQIQEYFDMFLKKSPIGSIDTFILQNFGDICISDGTYTFEIDGEGGNRESVAARYTYVWKKENKKWMIATHHSSVNPK
jgi:uncharacterized protein (TIGR02246 family)